MSSLFTFGQVYAQELQNWDTPGSNNCVVDGVPTLKCFEIVFGNILLMASSLVGLVLFIMFIIGSFNYITSLGNPEKIKKAQGTLQYAVVGLVIFISAFLILKIIDTLFLGGTGKIFQFTIGQ